MAKSKKSARDMVREAKAKGAKTKRTEAVRPTVKGKDADLLKTLDGAQAVTGGMWKGEVVGDSIIGEVLSLKREDTQYVDNQVVMILGTPDGAKTVFCNWSLEQGLLNESVNLNDRIGIQFKGEVAAGRGRPMRTYAVRRAGGKGSKASPILTAGTAERRKGKGKRR